MNPAELLRLALHGLAANKLRAALTMLGIIIGVAAVITLLSVGRGVERYVTAQFQGIGSNLLFIFPGGPDEQDGPPTAANRDKPLTNADGLALTDPFLVPSAQAVALEYLSFGTIEYSRETLSVQVSGVSTNYQAVRQFFVQDGDFISDADERSVARVAVLGQTVVKTLFPDGDFPLGQTIKINTVPFKVIGVLESQGGSLFGDQDSLVLIPLSTAQQRLFNARGPDGQYGLSIIYLQARGEDEMESAAQQATTVLRDRHNIDFRAEDDFTVRNLTEMVSARTQTTRLMSLLLGAVASISLVVGGIGIMNIMLVSVTERIREIGLRMAVGAGPREVQLQFLAEAMLISLAGGAIGIALGIGGALLAEKFGSLPVALNLEVILMATGFSVATGLFFGYYPARKASQLDPIEALRHQG